MMLWRDKATVELDHVDLCVRRVVLCILSDERVKKAVLVQVSGRFRVQFGINKRE